MVFAETNEGGLWIIVQDAQGQVMASLVQKIRYPQSVDSIEAWVAKRAVQLALEIGITEAEVEGDSLTIVKALNADTLCSALYTTSNELTC